MSFSRDSKLEIIQSRSLRGRTGQALAYGMLLFAGRYGEEEISLVTSSEEVAGRFERSLRLLCGGHPETSSTVERGRNYHRVSLPEEGKRRRLLAEFPPGSIDREKLPTPGHVQAFLAGAFLACGHMTDPQKGYHLEFAAQTEPLARELAALIDGFAPTARVTQRRGQYIVYAKECAQIEDLLTAMGASHASLAVIDVEMIKEVRNRANRATNCETANIDKQVGAAASQLDDIKLIYDTAGEEALSDPLREAARLRLQNPEASLRDLTELSLTPVSRSGMHHRLAALGRMARQIREEKGKERSDA